jgi:tripartite-type tricarboxylate transporter receptor subunit TctC
MTLHTRRSALRMLAAGGAAASVGLPAFSQQGEAFPSRVIRIVVPYPAGGTTDQLARAIAQPMREVLGQTVIVENKPGAGGTIGTDYVAKQPADGYTLVFGNSGPSATAGLMRKLPYDPQKDFRPISGVMRLPMILAVPADSPHKSVAEFVAWARSRGDKVNYGSTGVGGGSHLYSEYFNELAGTRFQHIPYTGAPPLLTAFAGGQVQMAFVTGLDGAAMVQAGKSATWRWRRPSGRQCCRTCLPSPRPCPDSRPWRGSACWPRLACPTPSHRSFPAPSPPWCAAPRSASS